MNKSGWVVLLGMAASCAAFCAAQDIASYSDPKGAPNHRVCTLHSDTRLVRIGAKGVEELTAESEEWAGKLDAAIRHAITEAGGELTGDLSPEAPKKNDETRQTVIRLRQKYENIAVQMLKKRGDVRKGRYSLGDEIALLSCARDADSIAFLDASWSIQTGGRKTISVLAGGLLGPASAMSRYRSGSHF